MGRLARSAEISEPYWPPPKVVNCSLTASTSGFSACTDNLKSRQASWPYAMFQFRPAMVFTVGMRLSR